MYKRVEHLQTAVTNAAQKVNFRSH